MMKNKRRSDGREVLQIYKKLPGGQSITRVLVLLLNLVMFVNKGDASLEDLNSPSDIEIESTLKSYAKASNRTVEDLLTTSTATVSAALLDPSHRRQRRSVLHLYSMVVCATGCNPLSYKGYGCYCGFLGSGITVDGIDKCCQKHDWCYDKVHCRWPMTYLIPYKWQCMHDRPKCVRGNTILGDKSICADQLCECDRKFAECLRHYPCPRTKAMCVTSPWRYWQNIFMRIGNGPSAFIPPPPPPPHSFSLHNYID